MDTVDDYIEVIKNKTGKTQLSIASELNYSREHFSRSKKSAPSLILKKLMSVFGFVKPGHETYDTTLQELKYVVGVITEKTGMSIEDISEIMYEKKYTIPESLSGDWVSPRMALAIRSKFQNLFIPHLQVDQKKDQNIILDTFKSNSDLLSCNFVYTLSDPIDSLLLKQGDLIFGSAINISDKLYPNKFYALKTITNQIFLGYVKKSEDSIKVTFDQKEIEPENVKLSSIKSLYLIQFSLKRI